MGDRACYGCGETGHFVSLSFKFKTIYIEFIFRVANVRISHLAVVVVVVATVAVVVALNATTAASLVICHVTAPSHAAGEVVVAAAVVVLNATTAASLATSHVTALNHAAAAAVVVAAEVVEVGLVTYKYFIHHLDFRMLQLWRTRPHVA